MNDDGDGGDTDGGRVSPGAVALATLFVAGQVGLGLVAGYLAVFASSVATYAGLGLLLLVVLVLALVGVLIGTLVRMGRADSSDDVVGYALLGLLAAGAVDLVGGVLLAVLLSVGGTTTI